MWSFTRISLQSLPSSKSTGYNLLVTVTEQGQSTFIVFSFSSQHTAKRVLAGQHKTFVDKLASDFTGLGVSENSNERQERMVSVRADNRQRSSRMMEGIIG